MSLSTFVHDSFINERLHISANTKSVKQTERTLVPKDKLELCKMIEDEMDQQGVDPDLNHIDVSNVIDLSYVFHSDKLRKIRQPKMDEWDTSNATTMAGMFADCTDFNADLSKWDISNVTNMYEMFRHCLKFNQDLSKWNVSNVEVLSAMFHYCIKFTSDLSKWDVSKAYNLGGMFRRCENFESDLSKWDVSNVYNFIDTFKECWKFQSDLSKWDMSKAKNISGMFVDCKAFESDLSGWDMSSLDKSVINVRSVFGGCPKMAENAKLRPKARRKPKKSIYERLHIGTDTKTVRTRPTSKKELQSIIKQELERQGPDADLNFIDVSGIGNMSSLFYDFSAQIQNIKIDQWDVSNVVDMNGMFYRCGSFNCDLSGWDVSNVKDMYAMFCGCWEFESDLSGWDVSNVTKKLRMFDDCTNMSANLKPKFK